MNPDIPFERAVDLLKAQKALDEQQDWIVEHGGSLAGYIAYYGVGGTGDCDGDGGEAIWNADIAEYAKRKAALHALSYGGIQPFALQYLIQAEQAQEAFRETARTMEQFLKTWSVQS